MFGAAIGLLVIIFVFGGLRAGTLKRLERQIRRLREVGAVPPQYREAGPEHAAALAKCDALTAEVRAAGLRVLGDVVEERSGITYEARAFVDDSGAVFGLAAVLQGRAVVIAISAAPDVVYASRRSRQLPVLAAPPFMHRLTIEPSATIGDLLAAHRSAADLPAAAAKYVRVTTLAEWLAATPAVHARTVAWRAEQAPTRLLDDDLDSILPARLSGFRLPLRRRLGVTVPEARARRA